MVLISRVNKFEVPVLIRILFGNHRCCKRCHSNYYKILRISQDATQKEIKDAFIKRAKELHPDCGNEGSHKDFVKLNEAYSVLSKPHTRQYYDVILKSNIKVNHNMQYNAHVFHDINKYDEKTSSVRDVKKVLVFCIALMIVGTTLQVAHIKMWSDYNRNKVFRRIAQNELRYQRTAEERMKFLESIKHGVNISDK